MVTRIVIFVGLGSDFVFAVAKKFAQKNILEADRRSRVTSTGTKEGVSTSSTGVLRSKAITCRIITPGRLLNSLYNRNGRPNKCGRLAAHHPKLIGLSIS